MLPPFQGFFDEHAGPVWRFCVAVAGRDQADDCFQDTFLAALRAYPTLKSAANLKGWVMRIAYTKAMDAHSGRRKRPRPVGEVPDAAARSHTERDDELWGRVRELPDKQRAAVAYRFALDMTYKDIARAMSCNEAAARRNVADGIKKLRKELG